MPSPRPPTHWTAPPGHELLHQLELDLPGHLLGVRLAGHLVEAGHLIVIARGAGRYLCEVVRLPEEPRCEGLAARVLAPTWPGSAPGVPTVLPLADLAVVDMRWPTHAELGLR